MVLGSRNGGRWPPRYLAGGAALLCLALFAAADALILSGAEDLSFHVRTHIVLLATAVCGWTVAAAVLRRVVFRPLELLGREIRIVASVNPAYEISLPGPHALGDIPEAVQELGLAVGSAKLAVADAVAERSRELESRRERLEAILTSLREGIVVCDERARIIFYNDAARQVFHGNPALGVGRSLHLLCAPAPIENALQVLRRRRVRQAEGDEPEEDVSFVCTALHGIVLSCRMWLLPESAEHSWSFLFVCEDISGTAAERERRENVLRETVRSMRAPLTRIGLSADSLELLPDLEPATRVELERALVGDARLLVEQFDLLARAVEESESPHLVMREVFVEDVVAAAAQKLEKKGVRLTILGDPLRVRADLQSLLFLIEFFALRIGSYCEVPAIEVETLLGDKRVYFAFCWRGGVVPQGEIQRWVATPVELQGGQNVADLLERHGSEVWSHAHETPGFSTLRFPVPAAPGQWAQPPSVLRSRPVYVDLSEPPRIELAEGWERQPLESAHFVVFDTETTGLAPREGDEIVSLAGVKVIERGIIVGEVFDQLVDPLRPIPETSVRIHGITDEKVRGMPRIAEVLRAFRAFVGDAVLVGHNGAFDLEFIRLKEQAAGVRFDRPLLDTLVLSRYLHDHTPAHSLDAVARRVGVQARDRHSALGDALITAQVLLKFVFLLRERGVTTLGDALNLAGR